MTNKVKTKFPTGVKLQAAGLNSHNLAELTSDKLYISWSPSSTGRGGMPASFHVHRIGYKTAPHWMDYGNKKFTVWGGKEGREKVIAEVIAWTDARYGKREWVKDPFGSYQDARVIPLVWKYIEDAKNAS